MAFLAEKGELVRVSEPVSLLHEMTEIHRRVLHAQGPALLFEKPVRADGGISAIPVLVNLFGTLQRIAWGFGIEREQLGALGTILGELREPQPPQGLREAWKKLPLAKAALNMRPRAAPAGGGRRHVLRGNAVDLSALPVQTHWPGEPAPLITWPLVITRPPDSERIDDYNMGVYRCQVLGRDRLITRWLAQRGGAKHHHLWKQTGADMPVAIAIGDSPATILAAVLPLPETLSELKFAGLFRGGRPVLADCVSVPLKVPAQAEIVIEGYASATETAPEGPFGDHTGYYNAVEPFPVMRVTAITMRSEPVYLSTYTGRPPDEPSRLGEALNEIFLPIVQRQFPEVADLWLPPEACSYRMAVAAIRKRYPGQARRLMMGLWSMIPQLTYTKTLIVVDDDIDPRNWHDVMWAVSTRSDPSRDLMIVENTPIDSLDFASPQPGLGGKLGIDATAKIGPETQRAWGEVMNMSEDVIRRVDTLWPKLGLTGEHRPSRKR